MKKKQQLDLEKATREELIERIVELEAAISGTSNLMTAINMVNDALAKELDERRDAGGLLADDAFFKQYVEFVAQIPKLKAMYTPEQASATKNGGTEEPQPDSKDSIFEQTQKRVKEKLKNGGG